jgi:hypothetical protein
VLPKSSPNKLSVVSQSEESNFALYVICWWHHDDITDLSISIFPQVLCLELALVIVWLIGVNSFPTIKSKNDYPRITQQNANQREIISRLFSKRTNYDITKILRSRRSLTSTFASVPTNTDRGILITKTNNMLTVFNGTVLGINDYNSKFGK